MLVLTRKPMERIRISDSIEIVFLGVRGGRAKIGIECPADIPIQRTELLEGNPRLGELLALVSQTGD